MLIEIFEIETVGAENVLRDYELWDSLSVISLLAVLQADYGITVEAEDLAQIVTAGDLFAFVEANRSS